MELLHLQLLTNGFYVPRLQVSVLKSVAQQARAMKRVTPILEAI
jgi:hypothetical protein